VLIAPNRHNPELILSLDTIQIKGTKTETKCANGGVNIFPEDKLYLLTTFSLEFSVIYPLWLLFMGAYGFGNA